MDIPPLNRAHVWAALLEVEVNVICIYIKTMNNSCVFSFEYPVGFSRYFADALYGISAHTFVP